MSAAPVEILLVGCGKMGAALLNGWLGAGVASRIHVVEPNPAAVPSHPLVSPTDTGTAASLAPDVVVLLSLIHI